MPGAATNMRVKLPVICLVLQIILIILFGVLVQYNHDTDAKQWHKGNQSDYENDFYYRYPSECRGKVKGYLGGCGSSRGHVLEMCSFFTCLFYLNMVLS